MKNTDQTQAVESRYEIQECHIIDAKKEVKNGSPIYIREILDSESHEFKSSQISSQDGLDIIGNLGLKKLIPVLEECFNSGSKPYNATHEAIFAIHKLLKGSYPTLPFTVGENDSKTKLVIQLAII